MFFTYSAASYYSLFQIHWIIFVLKRLIAFLNYIAAPELAG